MSSQINNTRFLYPADKNWYVYSTKSEPISEEELQKQLEVTAGAVEEVEVIKKEEAAAEEGAGEAVEEKPAAVPEEKG